MVKTNDSTKIWGTLFRVIILDLITDNSRDELRNKFEKKLNFY